MESGIFGHDQLIGRLPRPGAGPWELPGNLRPGFLDPERVGLHLAAQGQGGLAKCQVPCEEGGQGGEKSKGFGHHWGNGLC